LDVVAFPVLVGNVGGLLLLHGDLQLTSAARLVVNCRHGHDPDEVRRWHRDREFRRRLVQTLQLALLQQALDVVEGARVTLHVRQPALLAVLEGHTLGLGRRLRQNLTFLLATASYDVRAVLGQFLRTYLVEIVRGRVRIRRDQVVIGGRQPRILPVIEVAQLRRGTHAWKAINCIWQAVLTPYRSILPSNFSGRETAEEGRVKFDLP